MTLPSNQIILGDALTVLRDWPEESVQCVITSPPYWGLRSYDIGVENGEMGLEKTPGEYVAKMVEVFREVRRILRADGTLFLNLGDSYSGSWGAMSHDMAGKAKRAGTNKRPPTSFTSSNNSYILKEDLTVKEIYEVALEIQEHVPELWKSCWAEESEGPLSSVLSGQIQEGEQSQDARVAKEILSPEPSGVQPTDKESKASKTGGNDPSTRGQVCLLRRDRNDIPLLRSHQGTREARIQESGRATWSLAKGDSRRIAKGQIPNSLLELQFGIRFVRFLSSLRIDITSVPESIQKYFKPKQGLKPKDLIGIPWRVALALQADGWWLRSDIIWSKPNPMPESVTDRCTKSHEYIFLMTKSERYYYDAKAVAEPLAPGSDNYGDDGTNQKNETFDNSPITARYKNEWFKKARNGEITSRNRRSVWTIATKPFSEAHFATFPPDLVKICLMAGTKVGDVILDPFMGSGTTAVVAKNAGRQFVGIELNPEYIAMAERRLKQEVLAI
jgi:DNA modification methylase